MDDLHESLTCGVCLERYSGEDRAPLVLPCGHTYCRSCLATVERTADFRCPYCRKCWVNLQLNQLKVNFALLRVSSSCPSDIQECATHDDALKYWCYDCSTSLCGLCLASTNHTGHSVQLAKNILQQKKRDLQSRVETLREDVRRQQYLVLREILRSCSHLCKIDTQLTTLLTQVKTASTMHDIHQHELQLLDLIRTRQAESKNFFTASDILGAAPKAAAAEDAVSKVETTATAVVTTLPATDKDVCRAILDYHNGRCLLMCVSCPGDSRPSVQMPSEAFLELSVGQRRLGVVYIRLWVQLRRARQFLLLCLGTLGPSYLRATATSVDKYGLRQTLAFKNYISERNTKESTSVVQGLEWSGRYAQQAREGLVMASDSGSSEPAFGICIRADPNTVYNCPFGEVTLGFDVVQAAARHSLVTEVTITNCGVVIPDLSQLTQ